MEFLDNLYERSSALQQMVYIKEGKSMTWEQIALVLYGILDDIDTADDIAKENSDLYRGMVMKLQAKKNEYLASLDGQTVQRVNESMVDFARYELELAGLFSEDSDYDGMIGRRAMSPILIERSATLDEQSCFQSLSSYAASEPYICLGSIQPDRDSATQSVMTVAEHEGDLNPYDFMRLSGMLAFWDDPAEDLYSFEDGDWRRDDRSGDFRPGGDHS